MIHRDFLLYRIHGKPYRDSGQTIAGVKQPGRGIEKLRVGAVEELPRDDESEESEPAHLHAQFLQPQGAGFRSKEAEHAVTVQRRERDQVEKAKQNIEREKDAEDRRDSVGGARLTDRAHDMGRRGVQWHEEASRQTGP